VSNSAASSATSVENEFLSILTTELSNQDPLNAMDPSTFTSQLVGYAQLEQQLTTNQDLSTSNTSLSTITTDLSSMMSSLSAISNYVSSLSNSSSSSTSTSA
jgi:flagellar basal-body rod modification protein FlgD